MPKEMAAFLGRGFCEKDLLSSHVIKRGLGKKNHLDSKSQAKRIVNGRGLARSPLQGKGSTATEVNDDPCLWPVKRFSHCCWVAVVLVLRLGFH